jgi:colanic acid biosynthesis glycosyl transferase WcaI
MASRVLLLTQWFDPEPTFKGLVFARELIAQGFDVEVVTGFPNYPGGKVYPGYKVKLIQREVIDGIKIVRLPLYPSHGQSGIGRLFNYASFAISLTIYGIFCARRPSVIYAYHPPLTVGMAAVFIRFFRRIPVVYDIQDMWPDTLRATGMFSNEKLLNIVSGVCSWVYRHVDQIVVLSPGFKRLLVGRGVSKEKIDIIYNWCAEELLVKPTVPVPEELRNEVRFKILFAGNLGRAQALESIVAAAELVRKKTDKVVFIFLGGGIELLRLQKLVGIKELDNVVFLPAVPMAEVGAYLYGADALLVHLKKDPLFTITIPSKTQAYMAVGKPILMAVDGDAASLVREADCGIVSESDSPESIATAALALMELSDAQRERMVKNGQIFYREKLSLNVGVQRFGEHFKRLSKT